MTVDSPDFSAKAGLKPRVLIVMPTFNPPGGGRQVAVQAIAALHEAYRVSTLSVEPPDLDLINRHWGTDLLPGHFTALTVTGRLLPLLRHIPLPLAHLRYSVLLRACQRMAGDFDQVLGFYNEGNFGRAGIQYLHNPSSVSIGAGASVRCPTGAMSWRWPVVPCATHCRTRIR